MRQASTLMDGKTLHEGFTFTEALRWHEGRLWLSDLYSYAVYSAREDGSDLCVEAQVPGVPSGLGWLPDGRLLVVSMEDHLLLRREHDGRLVTHANLDAYVEDPKDVLNDLAVGPDGTAYVGSFGYDFHGGAPISAVSLFRVTREGEVSIATEPLHFPNGPTIIDNRTLVVAESFANRLSAFDIRADGSLSERRDWAVFGPLPQTIDPGELFPQLVVGSDGISAIDAEGAIWVADFLRTRCVRVRAGEGIIDQVTLSGNLHCFAAALGGADGRTLFLSATPAETDPEVRRNDPRAEIQVCRVDVPAG